MQSIPAAIRAAEGRARGSETTSRRAAIVRKAVALAVLHYREVAQEKHGASLRLARARLLSLVPTGDTKGIQKQIIRRAADTLASEERRLKSGHISRLTIPQLRQWAAAEFKGDHEAHFLSLL